MSQPRSSAAPAAGVPVGISIRDASVTWLGGWFLGSTLSSIVLSGSGADDIADAGPWWLAAAQLAAWIPLVGAILFVARRSATGSLVRDFGFTMRPLDLLGVPLGVLTQLGFVKLVYLPLQHLWPHTFSMSKIEQPARDLWNNAHGGGMLILILTVVVGAPLVEELTYRGLLQGAFSRCAGAVAGVVFVALWFAAIHFQAVNVPGLFVVGLVLGVCAQRTGRLGMSVLTHMAFNATGLILVAQR